MITPLTLTLAGRGFIHHPQLAPFISNIAAFHQLHCLVSDHPVANVGETNKVKHAVVIAYYDALESPGIANVADIQDKDQPTGTRIAVPHIRHCFDYLRQALMCSADTNLETVDHQTHLTNGWGQPKQCRDYEEIFNFAKKYANSTDEGIIAIDSNR